MLIYHFMAKSEVDINSIDSLTHKSDWHLISPYNITPKSHVQVARIKEVMRTLRSSSLRLFNYSFLWAPKDVYREQFGEYYTDVRVYRIKTVFNCNRFWCQWGTAYLIYFNNNFLRSIVYISPYKDPSTAIYLY